MLNTVLPYSWYVLNAMYILQHIDDNPFYNGTAAGIPDHKYTSSKSR
jgi:hypothetical protein